jgi:crotonobetainyl-CoA:carnitine CoA-transferase CaiB-like acyl-CoA transferase
MLSPNTFKQNFQKSEHKPKIENTNGPLQGINILEFSYLVAGPMANMILSDQGANVVKIEIDNYLDPSRKIGTNKSTSLSSLFACLNRNKKSTII